MIRFAAFGILIILGIWASVLWHVGIVGGADPTPAKFPPQNNPDTFQYQGVSLDVYNPFSGPLRQNAIWRWRFEKNPACPGDVRPYVVTAIQDLTNNFAINFIEDPAGHLIYQNCGPSLAARCGATNINCLGRGFPYDVTIDLSSDLAVYFPETSVSIVEHELLHAMSTWNEQYLRTSGGGFAASDDVTVMNIGPLSRHFIRQDERDRWNRTMGPASLKIAGQGRNPDGRAFVYFCQPPERTTRVALLYDDGQGIYWSGRYADAGLDANGCRGVLVEERPGRSAYLKSESAVSWKTSYTEVRAGAW